MTVSSEVALYVLLLLPQYLIPPLVLAQAYDCINMPYKDEKKH